MSKIVWRNFVILSLGLLVAWSLFYWGRAYRAERGLNCTCPKTSMAQTRVTIIAPVGSLQDGAALMCSIGEEPKRR